MRFPGIARADGLRRSPGLKRDPCLGRYPCLMGSFGLGSLRLMRYSGLMRFPELENSSGLVRCPGLSGTQDEEMEGVVILEEEENLLEEDADQDSRSRIQDVPVGVSQDVDPPGKRLSAILRRFRSEWPRLLSYNEIIEGLPKVVFPKDLEFEFEIPSEKMDL